MHLRARRINAAVVWGSLLSACACGCAAWAQAPAAKPAAPPSAPPAASAPAPAATIDPEVEKILDRLEQREVRDLRARVEWESSSAFGMPGDEIVKRGEVWYQDAKPVARFLVSFNEKAQNQRRDSLDEKHLFDGCWYTRIRGETRTVERDEVRRADSPYNPYRVGDGVFPLPFGQKKVEILLEFDVRRVPPAEKDPPHTEHLFLTPRPGSRNADRYKSLDFWIATADGKYPGLPVKVRVGKKDGAGKLSEFIVITFDDVLLNSGFATSVFDVPSPAGYERIEEPLKP